MPLSLVKIGERVKVVNVTGLDAVRKHLGAMGLIPGEVIAVVQIAEGNMILGIHDSRRRVDFLLHTSGLVAAFVLLRTLRFEEHDSYYLTSVCRQLMHRASTLSHSTGQADSLSFNMASLLRTYFDLPDLRGTFSLTLEPYELSRLDTDFDVFRRAITKV